MSHPDPEKRKDRQAKKRPHPITRKNLDRFLSSICEAGGMSGASARGREEAASMEDDHRLVCRGPCVKADWRAHLDIPTGIICVSAAWSHNTKAEKHRDVTLGLTYYDSHGKVRYTDMIFCDSEVRWLMETLWHAPLWD
jgi:hypothetical protein